MNKECKNCGEELDGHTEFEDSGYCVGCTERESCFFDEEEFEEIYL